jgi:hypothetical protein
MTMRSYRGWAIRRLSDGKYSAQGEHDSIWVDDLDRAYPHLSQSHAWGVVAEYHKGEDVEVIRGGHFWADPDDKHPLPVDFSEPLRGAGEKAGGEGLSLDWSTATVKDAEEKK